MKSPTKKAVRQERIISALELNPTLRVNDLANVLDVSVETVRRDLAQLDDSGRIKRTYGGAVRTTGFEPALTERLQLHVRERERMAKHAVDLIDDAGSIYVGGGASTLHFARALRLYQTSLTVLTPALGVAVEVATNPKIETNVLPGFLEATEGLVHGAETLHAISRYQTPLAVVGASAFDEHGVSEALLTAAQVYSAIVSKAEHTIVLADQSKCNKRSLQSILEWGPNTTLLTDSRLPSELHSNILETGARILVAESD